jgi:hypothetical protein
MQQTSIIRHIIMILIAGAIVVLYIQPTIQQIRQNQDSAVLYNAEVEKVTMVNQLMAQKLATINSIPLTDRQKLITYMPDNVEEVSVLRTLETILFSVGIQPSTLELSDEASDVNNSESQDALLTGDVTMSLTQKKDIAVSFVTDEATLQLFFRTIASSDIPFVLHSATITPQENNQVAVDITYSVFSLLPASSTVGDSAILVDDMNFIE